MILAASIMASGALTAGCYSLQPTVGVTPDAGVRIAFDINDAGRVALGGSMGPEIDQVEGRLLEKSSDEYLVSVTNVRFLRGGYQVWKGEQVRINSTHVRSAYIRKLSPTRSVILGTVLAGGFVAFMASRGLIGGGNTGDQPGRDSIPNDALIPIRIRP